MSWYASFAPASAVARLCDAATSSSASDICQSSSLLRVIQAVEPRAVSETYTGTRSTRSESGTRRSGGSS